MIKRTPSVVGKEFERSWERRVPKNNETESAKTAEKSENGRNHTDAKLKQMEDRLRTDIEQVCQRSLASSILASSSREAKWRPRRIIAKGWVQDWEGRFDRGLAPAAGRGSEVAQRSQGGDPVRRPVGPSSCSCTSGCAAPRRRGYMEMHNIHVVQAVLGVGQDAGVMEHPSGGMHLPRRWPCGAAAHRQIEWRRVNDAGLGSVAGCGPGPSSVVSRNARKAKHEYVEGIMGELGGLCTKHGWW